MRERVSRFVSNVLALAWREAASLRHDQAFLSMILIQPVIMLLLMGFVVRNEPANVEWGVMDQSRSKLSRRLVEEIQSTGYFLPPLAVASYEEARDLMSRGRLVAVLVVPPDLQRASERGRPRAELLLDGAEPLSAARVAGYIGAIAREVEVRSLESFELGGSRSVLELKSRFRFNPTLDDATFFLAALAGMLLTNLCMSVTSLGIVAEREAGTYEQMLAQPTSAIEIVLGKLVPNVVISYALLVFSILSAGLGWGLWPKGSVVALFLVTLPFVLSSLSIGVFVSTLARDSGQAVFLTVFAILPSFVLSGVMMPYQLMPAGIRELGFIFPLRWYQIALRRLIVRGGGLVDIAVPMIALWALFAVLLVLIHWRLKPRLG